MVPRQIFVFFTVLLMLVTGFRSIQIVKATTTPYSWTRSWGCYYNDPPVNISSTTVRIGANGHVRTEVELVTTIFKYIQDDFGRPQDKVCFRTAVYVRAFADPGYVPQNADRIEIVIDKTDANEPDRHNTWTRMEIDPNSRGSSQGYYVWQSTTKPSTFDERWDWIRVPICFALSAVSEPLAVAIFLVSWASSFQPSNGLDYHDAELLEDEAWSCWGNGLPDSETGTCRQYCFNMFTWWMYKDLIPLAGHELTIRAFIAPQNTHVITPFYTNPVYITISSTSGGACPYICAWDGSHHVLDNNILPASEISGGTDVEDYYRLEKGLVPYFSGISFSLYTLKITEFEQEHSYIDKARLLGVDHGYSTEVAVTPNGELLTYGDPIAPISAFDEEGNDVLQSVATVGGEYYESHDGSYITLTFERVNVEYEAKLVIRDDKPPVLKCPVYVQVMNSLGDWNTVAVFYTRTYWATDIIDLSESLYGGQGDILVRLSFISDDKIDYVGLDTSSQSSIQIWEVPPILALHSANGDVTTLLLENDQTYVEITLHQEVLAVFWLPRCHSQERDFVLYSEGHYYTID